MGLIEALIEAILEEMRGDINKYLDIENVACDSHWLISRYIWHMGRLPIRLTP